MSEIGAVPRFTEVNPTLTFFKPELRAFVADTGAPTAQSFLTLIDIEKKEWNEEQRRAFYAENFPDQYDAIECAVSQLDAVLHMPQLGSMRELQHTPRAPATQPQRSPGILVLHANKGEEAIRLPSDKIHFFIIVGDVERFGLARNGGTPTIYHRGRQATSFYVYDDEIEGGETTHEIEPPATYTTRYEIQHTDGRLQRELNGRFKPTGQPNGSYPDAVIRHFGTGDQLNTTKDKEKYIVSLNDSVRGFTPCASISIRTGVMISDTRNEEESSKYTRFIIAHGRITPSKSRRMINIDANGDIRVLFPDMSQKEVDSILFDHRRLFGNDRELPSGRNVIGSCFSFYLTDGFTFAEQILYNASGRDPEDAGSDFNRMTKARSERTITCISLIDNYFNTIQLKRPNGFFEYMLTKYTASLEERDIATLEDRKSIHSLITSTKERLERESQVDSNRREIMLARIRGLGQHQQRIPPYYLEPVVDNPVLFEEQRLRERLYSKKQHDPNTHRRQTFTLKPVQELKETYIISEINYMILDGMDYNCVIHNCGFVILKGNGKVRISGTIHSLVCEGDINLELDNTSPTPICADTHLYMENGSIYDTITNFRDTLEPEALESILRKRPDEMKAPPQEPPRSTLPEGFKRSVIKNLYVYQPPPNYITAMIENLIDISSLPDE